MRNRDIQTLENHVRQLEDLKDEFNAAIASFQSDITLIERELDREFSLSHIITTIKNELKNTDVDEMFEFVDNIKTETDTLYYKHKKAEQANQISTFRKVINPSIYNLRQDT